VEEVLGEGHIHAMGDPELMLLGNGLMHEYLRPRASRTGEGVPNDLTVLGFVIDQLDQVKFTVGSILRQGRARETQGIAEAAVAVSPPLAQRIVASRKAEYEVAVVVMNLRCYGLRHLEEVAEMNLTSNLRVELRNQTRPTKRDLGGVVQQPGMRHPELPGIDDCSKAVGARVVPDGIGRLGTEGGPILLERELQLFYERFDLRSESVCGVVFRFEFFFGHSKNPGLSSSYHIHAVLGETPAPAGSATGIDSRDARSRPPCFEKGNCSRGPEEGRVMLFRRVNGVWIPVEEKPEPKPTTISVYLDESYDEKQEVVYVLAGHIGDEENWSGFDDEWNEVLRSNGIEHDYFHTNPFEVGKVEPWKSLKADQPRHKAVLNGLLDVIRKNAVYPFGSMMLLSEFEALQGNEWEIPTDDPYKLALEVALRAVNELCEVKPGGTIRFICDENQEMAKWVLETFQKMKVNNKAYGKVFGTLEFAKAKVTPPLCAADLVAFEVRKHVYNAIKNPEVKMRYSMNRIITDGPSRFWKADFSAVIDPEKVWKPETT
jgi:hypothetical protein